MVDWRALGAVMLLVAVVGSARRPIAGAPPPRLAVLSFELRDFTPTPNLPARVTEAQRGGEELERILSARCRYDVVAVSTDAERRARSGGGAGYLAAHPTVAAQVAHDAGADWAVVGELSVSSPIVSEFHVLLVRAPEGSVRSAISIELKGNAGDSALFARGIAHVAQQVDRALASAGSGSDSARRCPAL